MSGAIAAAQADPIFAAIDRHKAAFLAFEAACKLTDEVAAAQEGRTITEADRRLCRAADEADEAAMKALTATIPTTPAGACAAIAHIARHAEGYPDATAAFVKTLSKSGPFMTARPTPRRAIDKPTLRLNDRPCPAAAIAAEDLRLGAALLRAMAADRSEPNGKYDGLCRTLRAQIAETQRRASLVRATSAEGALFQIAVQLEMTDSLVTTQFSGPDAEQQKLRLFEEISRLAWSVCGFVESATGARRESVMGEFLMIRTDDPFAELDEVGATESPAAVDALGDAMRRCEAALAAADAAPGQEQLQEAYLDALDAVAAWPCATDAQFMRKFRFLTECAKKRAGADGKFADAFVLQDAIALHFGDAQ